jgi:hypothetical protein
MGTKIIIVNKKSIKKSKVCRSLETRTFTNILYKYYTSPLPLPRMLTPGGVKENLYREESSLMNLSYRYYKTQLG